MADNKLYYGDNLEVLAKIPSESVDLVYLDPPFNSACGWGGPVPLGRQD